jgi:hypothetical protein
MEGDLEGVTRKVIEAALIGDMVACRLVLDRVAPARKGYPVTFALPETLDADGIAQAFESVIRAMAAGELTSDEASTIAGILEERRKSLETVEFERRLRAVEERGAS